MSTLIFKLSMPNRGSWNGRWSGEEDLYAIVKDMGVSKKAKTQTEELLKARSWYHNFGDGWGASVSVSEATPAEARRVKKATRGFCGYDWMVRDILDHGYIGDRAREEQTHGRIETWTWETEQRKEERE